jgi:hypothetical protein
VEGDLTLTELVRIIRKTSQSGIPDSAHVGTGYQIVEEPGGAPELYVQFSWDD